ncbi:vacuolar protein sorting-associated protein 28-like [Schistocerca gregaria]|uniref:vacuolar protein sorting-associated protein 28-like n=1 Tax=Schistocerca gregaria TaxID=7010 RepID=UPI00211E2C3C|nr:vacuolar protein sorting-associated protein 28-like [Schistocerca gregaria]
MTTEALERLYTRDGISKTEYREHCKKLITQFRSTLRLENVGDVRSFMDKYCMNNCPLAYHRLVEVGVPDAEESNGSFNKLIAETVQYFITISDCVKLRMVAVDEIHSLFDALMDRLKSFTMSPDSEAITRVQKWLGKLNTMNVYDKLDEDQERQMAFDIGLAYETFYKYLGTI